MTKQPDDDNRRGFFRHRHCVVVAKGAPSPSLRPFVLTTAGDIDKLLCS
jgi:hypothetical protein